MITYDFPQNEFSKKLENEISLGRLDKVKVLIAEKIIEKDDDYFRAVLSGIIFAEEQGYPEITMYLLNYSYELNKTPGFSVLHWVAGIREAPDKTAVDFSSKLIKILISQGADVNARSESGITPLQIASFKGNVEAVKYLINAGADVNAKDDCGHSALHQAVSQEYFDVVKLLIGKNSNINAQNKNGWTPLHLATFRKSKFIVELLLNASADKNIKNFEGLTALDMAKAQGSNEIVELLQK